MEFLFVIVIIIILGLVLPKPGEPGGPLNQDQHVVQKKECPPHQWFWQEIVDQNGNRVGERICCKRCGPLQSYNGRE